MRSKDPSLMEDISGFVGEYYRTRHASPTVRTIAEALAISKSTAHNYLVEMADRGMLSYREGTVADLPKITKTQTGFFAAPLVGSIRCGDPESEEEEVEMYVSLPEALFGKGEYYLLRAVGDSMTDAGIAEGDLVLIKRQTGCVRGDVVVALDQNGENTLKVYGGINTKTRKAVLRYANELSYPGKTIEVPELTVTGVAKYVIKAL